MGASISDMYTFVYIYFWPRLIFTRGLVGLVGLDPPYGFRRSGDLLGRRGRYIRFGFGLEA